MIRNSPAWNDYKNKSSPQLKCINLLSSQKAAKIMNFLVFKTSAFHSLKQLLNSKRVALNVAL